MSIASPSRITCIRLVVVTLVLVLTALLVTNFNSRKVNAAACTAPATDYGSVSMDVTVPEAAVYRIWTRINTPNTSNNTYLLEVDANNCYNVGGSNLQANTWTW